MLLSFSHTLHTNKTARLPINIFEHEGMVIQKKKIPLISIDFMEWDCLNTRDKDCMYLLILLCKYFPLLTMFGWMLNPKLDLSKRHKSFRCDLLGYVALVLQGVRRTQ